MTLLVNTAFQILTNAMTCKEIILDIRDKKENVNFR